MSKKRNADAAGDGCIGKLQLPTRKVARDAARNYQRSHGEQIDYYECRWCGYFHLGHNDNDPSRDPHWQDNIVTFCIVYSKLVASRGVLPARYDSKLQSLGDQLLEDIIAMFAEHDITLDRKAARAVAIEAGKRGYIDLHVTQEG